MITRARAAARTALGTAAVLGRTTSAVLLLSSVAVSTIGVASGIIASRALGPVGRGEFALITYWPALIAVLIELGIVETVTLRTAVDANAQNRTITTGFLIAAACSIVGLAAGFFVLPYLLRRDQMSLLFDCRWYLLFVPASLLTAAAQGALLGLQRFRTAAALRTGTALVFLGSAAVLWRLGRLTPVTLAVLNVVFAAVPAAVTVAILVQMKIGAPSATLPELRRQLDLGSRLQGSRLASALASSEDRAIANLTLSTADIGCYQIPAALTNFMPVIPQALSQLMFARMGKRTAADRKDLLLPTYARTLLLTVASVAVLLPLLPILIPFVYGRDFGPAVVPSMIIVVASIIGSSSAVLQAAAKAAMHVRPCVIAEVVAIVTMAAVAIPLMRAGNLTGLAVAYLVGRIVSFAWMFAIAERVIGIPRRDLWPWSAGFRESVRRDVAIVMSSRASAKKMA